MRTAPCRSKKLFRVPHALGIARVDIDDVSRTYLPYLVALLIGLFLIAAIPAVTLVLPRLLLGYKG